MYYLYPISMYYLYPISMYYMYPISMYYLYPISMYYLYPISMYYLYPISMYYLYPISMYYLYPISMYYLYKLMFRTCRQAQRQNSANSTGARVGRDRSPSCNTFGCDVTIFCANVTSTFNLTHKLFLLLFFERATNTSLLEHHT